MVPLSLYGEGVVRGAGFQLLLSPPWHSDRPVTRRMLFSASKNKHQIPGQRIAKTLTSCLNLGEMK